MKEIIQNTLVKLSGLLACAAMFLALTSVNSTCMFMLYQPDVPEELL